MHSSWQMFPLRERISSCLRNVAMVLASCGLIVACGQLSAQTGGTGAISGAITDPGAALVSGAQVKLTDTATGYTRTVESNDRGLYLVSLLPPGRYTMEVSKQGFKVASSPDVHVIVAETEVLNIHLELGTTTETVTVSTSNVELQTESSDLGRVTEGEMIENLPLVARNYTQIIGLNPGVSQEANNAGTVGRGGGSQAANPAGGSIMSQGATSIDNNFKMNGLTVNDVQSSGIYSAGIPVSNPDTIQEFKVQTTLFDATSGRNAGANVDVITKGGTNDFHATLFEYFRNEVLNANDWFAKNQGQVRPRLRQNQYGFTASGPVVKRKLLAFGSYQGTKQSNALDASCHKYDLLPPLTNDRSQRALGAVFAGDSGYLGPYFGTILPDGSNISPQALALLQRKLPNGQYVIPTPQKIDPSKPLETRGSAFLSDPCTFNENQWMANTDYLRSDRNKISIRYFGEGSTITQTLLFSTPGFALHTPNRFDVASIADTYIFGPNLVNQVVIGMHRSTSDQNYDNAFNFSTLGINVPSQEDAYPQIDIAYSGLGIGTSSALRFLQNEYNAADNLSWVKGKHRFEFGGGFGFGRDNMSKFNYQGYVIPLTWADLMLGQSYTLAPGLAYSNIYQTFEGLGDHARDWRYKTSNAFAQDNYQVSRRLTLNLGLRYERIGNLGEARGLGGNVDVSKLNPNPSTSGSFDGYLVNSNYHGPAAPAGVIKGTNTFGFNGQGQDTWNPRLGFSWLLPGSDAVVLRGGAGIYHTSTEGQMNLQLSAEAPYGLWSNLIGPANGASTIANPFPVPPALPAFQPYTPTTQYTMDALGMDWRPPTIYHYALGVQTRLPGGAILEVGYSGSRDLHTILGRTINQANLASPSNPIRGVTTNTVANIDQRKPYLGWSTAAMYFFNTSGQANYNSLQAGLSQRLSHRLTYQASFTWARLLTPVPGFTLGTNGFGPSGDQNALRAHGSGYGPEPYIRPLRFVLSALYTLPSPSREHAFLAHTLGGWAIATTTLAQDGHSLSIGYSNQNNVYGITTDRASFATGCNARMLATAGSPSQRVNHYVNAACLTTPAIIGSDGIGTGFGNTPNGILRGPGQVDVDLAISKTAKVNWPKDTGSVQLRGDFFNTLNHPNFYDPNLSYAPTAGAFGTITATSTNPRLIQLALRFSF